MCYNSQMKPDEEPKIGEKRLNIGTQNEKALGPELFEAVCQLAEASEEFENLVVSQRMTVRDLLEYMEVADLIDVSLIQRISTLADQLFAHVLKKYSYINDPTRRNKKVEETVGVSLNMAFKACGEGRPILSYLLFQANIVHNANDFNDRLREHLERKRKLPPHEDPYFAEKVYLEDMERSHPQRSMFIKNEDQLVVLMARAKLNPGQRLGDKSGVQALYRRYKTAVLEPAIKGGGIEGAGSQASFFSKVQLSFPDEQDIGGPLQLCQFTLTFKADQTRVFTGTVSRLDGGLYFPGSVVAPLKPIFEGQGELALYEEMRAAIFFLLSAGEKGRSIRVQSIDAIELGPDAVEEVQGKTEEKILEVQEPEPEPKEPVPAPIQKERFQKGVGTKLSGLDTQRIITALSAFGIQESPQARGHHTILEQITPTGRITYPFPTGHGAGKETANMAKILTRALKRFGVDRDAFLKSYHKK